jgi:hypothetical protein
VPQDRLIAIYHILQPQVLVSAQSTIRIALFDTMWFLRRAILESVWITPLCTVEQAKHVLPSPFPVIRQSVSFRNDPLSLLHLVHVPYAQVPQMNLQRILSFTHGIGDTEMCPGMKSGNCFMMKHRASSFRMIRILPLILGLAVAYVPPSHVEYFEHRFSSRDVSNDSVDLGLELLSQKYGISTANIQVTQSYRDSDGILHIYGLRLLNGIPVANQNFAIHLRNGKTISISSSYQPTATLQKRQVERVGLTAAVAIAEKELGIKRDSFPAQKLYLQTSAHQLTLVHQFQLRDDAQNKWVQVAVDTVSGKVVQVVDYVSHATFDAIKYTNRDIESGFERIVNPETTLYSPLGWNNDGEGIIKETRGNNVDSILWGANFTDTRTSSTEDLEFFSEFSANAPMDSEQNLRAAKIQSFYGTSISSSGQSIS